MSAIDDLRDAADRFEAARLELDAKLHESGFRVIEIQALAALGADVVSCARHLLPPAIADEIESTARKIAAIPPNTPRPEVLAALQKMHEDGGEAFRVELAKDFDPERIRADLTAMAAAMEAGVGADARLLLCFKAAYFMIRSLQDALYRVAFEVATGERPSLRRASMQNAREKEENPVSEILGDFRDDYFQWFDGWRNMRNSIKIGRPDAILGPPPGGPIDDYGLNLALASGDGRIEVNCSAGTRISDVTRAIEMSTELTIRITAAVQKGITQSPDAA